MSVLKIQAALARRFSAPKPSYRRRRIIFWYDDDGSFALEAPTLVPDGVKCLVLQSNVFQIKKTLERDDPNSDYLVYSPSARPGDRENHLLDVELHSELFSADRASLMMDDLGVKDPALKPVLDRHSKFFASKERLAAFSALGQDWRTADDVERGILAVVSRTRTLDAEGILRAVLTGSLDEDQNDLWKEIQRAGVDGAFWAMAREWCGYDSPQPGLKMLFLSLVMTAAIEELELGQNTVWGGYLLGGAGRARAVVFVDHWRKHPDDGEAYARHAADAWREMELERAAGAWSADTVAGAFTFEAFDLMVLVEVVGALEAEGDAFDRWEGWIKRRPRSRWWPKYQACYEALLAAIALMRLRREFEGRFREGTAREMVEAYVADYHLFDRRYREFVAATERVDSDLLHGLQSRVDALYTDWFLNRLMDRWNTLVESDLAASWRMDGVKPQRQFFEDYARGIAGERNKVFVLISDGLRYEVATRLAEALETATRTTPELRWMLGSVPSYTELGMAALLPNRTIAWDENGHVTADGQSTASGNRGNILKQAFAESLVVSYQDLMDWSREEARDALGGARIVYIYHNTIDYIGDKVASEKQTCRAAEQAVEELTRAVLKICNSLNGTYVVVTADHGFLYQRTSPPESDRVAVDKMEKVAGGRRFLLTQKGKQVDGAIEMTMDWLLGRDCGLSVYVAKGNLRFRAQGGARYVHGGASLQEVVIPVLLHTHVRKSYTKAEEARKVDVELTNTDRRITNAPAVCNFFQVEPVGGKLLPRRLRVALWTTGPEPRKVSTDELLIADRSSERPEERTFAIRLHLNPGVPNGDYRLRLEDDETKIEVRSIPFRLSLAITQINFWND